MIDAYRDGVWLVELGSISNPLLVPTSVAQVLGVQERAGTPLVDTLCAHLKARQLLLILDNCEHLLDACATLADAVLRSAADTTIIATSREPLHVAGEQTYPLQTLSLPEPSASAEAVARSEAVQLFVERARRQLPDFELTAARAPAVAAAVHPPRRHSAGAGIGSGAHSLAVDRADQCPVARSLQAADQREPHGAAAPADAARHARLELRPARRRRAHRAAAARRSSPAASRSRPPRRSPRTRRSTNSPSSICSRSSSRARWSSPIPNDGGARYRLLETMRAYALEKLAEAEETDAVRRRHAQYFRDLFERAPDDWVRLPDAEWRARYLPELDNVRAALDWALGSGGDPAIGVGLSGAAGELWYWLRTRARGPTATRSGRRQRRIADIGVGPGAAVALAGRDVGDGAADPGGGSLRARHRAAPTGGRWVGAGPSVRVARRAC